VPLGFVFARIVVWLLVPRPSLVLCMEPVLVLCSTRVCGTCRTACSACSRVFSFLFRLGEPARGCVLFEVAALVLFRRLCRLDGARLGRVLPSTRLRCSCPSSQHRKVTGVIMTRAIFSASITGHFCAVLLCIFSCCLWVVSATGVSPSTTRLTLSRQRSTWSALLVLFWRGSSSLAPRVPSTTRGISSLIVLVRSGRCLRWATTCFWARILR